jgi:hypothetical protein
MLLSVFGTPSALMYGGLNVVRNLVELGIGAHKLVNANSTADLRRTFSELGLGRDARAVFYSDLPDADLCALFIKTRAPMVLFMDGFDDVVGYVSQSRTMSLSDSIRLASRSICALEPLIRSDMVLKFDSKSYRRPVRDIVLAAGTFFGLALPAETVDQIASSLIKDAGVQPSLSDYLFRTYPHAALPGAAIRGLAPEDRRLVGQLAAAYSAIAAGRSFDQIDWPIGLFMNNDNPDAPFPGRVELLGPARFIAYGPYLHLTAGHWQASVVFEIADNHSGNQLYVDAYAGEILSVVTTRLPPQGTYRFGIGFEISNPLEPVQLRFQTLSGAIEGVFTLSSVSLKRIGEGRSIATAGAHGDVQREPA